jgi:hypothetical protein
VTAGNLIVTNWGGHILTPNDHAAATKVNRSMPLIARPAANIDWDGHSPLQQRIGVGPEE